MDEKVFKQLKEEYDAMQTNYQLQIDLYRKKAVRKCFNKGYLIDILPFEHELHGYKLRKKPLQRMVMENDCFAYYFNAEDKICLVEEANTFLKNIDDYTLYDYSENCMYKCECQQSGVLNVNKYLLENGKVVEGYTYAKFGHSHEQYIYSEGRLEKIVYIHFDHQQGTRNSWENHFFYNKNKELKLIQRVCDNGYVVNNYADIKLNYKKLEAYLYEACKEKIKLFFNEHVAEKVEAMALRLWIDDLEPILDINFCVSEDKENSIAEWTYASIATISITDVPLDSGQQDKIVPIVYTVLIKLIDDGTIYKDIKLKVFHHDEQEIGLEKRAIQKIIKGREKFFY